LAINCRWLVISSTQYSGLKVQGAKSILSDSLKL
jgi:hypothetical protein